MPFQFAYTDTLNIAFDRYTSIGTVRHYILVISVRLGFQDQFIVATKKIEFTVNDIEDSSKNDSFGIRKQKTEPHKLKSASGYVSKNAVMPARIRVIFWQRGAGRL